MEESQHSSATTLSSITNRQSYFLAIVMVSIIGIASSVSAQDPHNQTQTSTPSEKALVNEVRRMKWVSNTTVVLPNSHGTIAIPNEYSAILGNDARRLDQIENGKQKDRPLEAAVISRSPGSDIQVDFEFFDIGYVDESDWNTLNPADLLQSVSQATEEHNPELRAEGLPELHVVKWLQEPVHDNVAHTVYWAFEARDSAGEYVVNSIAIRLGRTGYEKLIAITDLSNYKSVGGPLDVMVRAFSFRPGRAYEDHASTDRAAGYGIAALVGMVIGAKVVKVAAAGGFALFFKPILAFFAVFISKLWVLLLAPFVWIKSLFKGLKKRRGRELI